MYLLGWLHATLAQNQSLSALSNTALGVLSELYRLLTKTEDKVARNKGIRCTLSTFADDIKLNGVADTPEGQDGIHRDLDKLENRACGNLTWFNKIKCEVLHLGQGGPCYQSSLGDEQI
ncbi:hypothetical protein DUI87_10899 [Hirundo rustica rustica]|uniref:Reverse transcriptase domain-containing protein n=1 Tax=Hirundo rustica rustica TaxID=333673 RepID=A0A3M0KPX4_HIRRU|nr:hypothetical protein DUI87_10899 [Hirundo rustica rustica]